jgi:rhodanese-related sulfurtransferase
MTEKSWKITGAAILLIGALYIAVWGPGTDLRSEERQIALPETVAADAVPSIAPWDLATRIAKGEKNFFVVDLRSPQKYALYHIKGATNIPVSDSLDLATIKVFPRNKAVVLYCTDGNFATRVAKVLRQYRVQAEVLKGGLQAWWTEVMSPPGVFTDLPKTPDELAKREQVRRYFTGGPTSTFQAATPATKATVAPPPAVTIRHKKRKKEEGC